MGNLNENFKLIERYFEGELKEEELSLFEHKLKTDADFADAYQTEKDLVEGIQAAGNINLAKRINEVHEKKMAERLANQSTKQVPLMRRLRMVAAVFLVAIIAGFAIWKMNQRPSKKHDFSAYFSANYKAPTFDNLTRGANNGLGSTTINKKYGNKNYEGALVELDALLDKNPKKESALLMKAICQMETDDFLGATETLRKIPADSPWYDTSIWYLGLNYLKLNQLDAAQIEFQKLIDDSIPMTEKREDKVKWILDALD